MADVFISYKMDTSLGLVEKIVELFEEHEISCWYAKRNQTDDEHAQQIPKEIDQCKIFLLVLNKEACESVNIQREMHLAAERMDRDKNFHAYVFVEYPMKMEEMGNPFRYYLSMKKRVEAFDIPLKERIQNLYDLINGALDGTIDAEENRIDDYVEYPFSPDYLNVAPLSGNYYCDRPEYIEKVQSAFRMGKIAFIRGVSGTGKSELARAFALKMHFEYVIPLELSIDGYGDLNDLKQQIKYNLKYQGTRREISELISENALVIIDNYNTLENNVIYDIQKGKLGNCFFLITSQLGTSELQEWGEVVSLGGLDEAAVCEDLAFAKAIFCRYARLDLLCISDEEQKLVEEIVTAVHNHTMLVGMIGKQYVKMHFDLHILRDKIKKDLDDYLKSNIKVNVQQNSILIRGVNPYELLKILFNGKILKRDFTKMEREVLGAILLLEPYTKNFNYICNVIGDHEGINLYEARNALNTLHEDGLIELTDKDVYIHPLIQILITDHDMGTDAIAQTEYSFLEHLAKNIMVEDYADNHPGIIALPKVQKEWKWFGFIPSLIYKTILPHRCKESELFCEKLKKQTYYIMMCRNEVENEKKGPVNGGSIIILFQDGSFETLVDGSMQNCEAYRYYSQGLLCTVNDVGRNYSVRATLVDCCIREEQIEIPEKVGSYTVEKIGGKAFRGETLLRNVQLPKGLKVIGEYAFADCVNLETVKMGEGTTHIQRCAFANCTNLMKIDGFDTIQKIYHDAFSGCRGLQDIVFGKQLEYIGRYAFLDTSLKYVKIPNSIKVWGRGSFGNCIHLARIEIEEKIDFIAAGAFEGCKQLKEIKIPANIKIINAGAFANCEQLEYVYIEEGVERIKEDAFSECKNIKEIFLPDSLLEISRVAFSQCPSTTVAVIKRGSSVERMIEMARVSGKCSISYRLE